MKKIFVVRGSEDGNLVVFTNKKNAYECAEHYTQMNGGAKITYAQMCRLFKTWSVVEVESVEGYGGATVEQFNLNELLK